MWLACVCNKYRKGGGRINKSNEKRYWEIKYSSTELQNKWGYIYIYIYTHTYIYIYSLVGTMHAQDAGGPRVWSSALS